jgi:hypothetical protein
MGTTSDFAIKAGPIVIGLGLIWYIVNIVRSYLRLRHFKGPTIAGFSNLWVFLSTLQGELNERTAEILKENGSSLAFIILRVEPSSLTELLRCRASGSHRAKPSGHQRCRFTSSYEWCEIYILTSVMV